MYLCRYLNYYGIVAVSVTANKPGEYNNTTNVNNPTDQIKLTLTPSSGDNTIVKLCLSAPTGSLATPGGSRMLGNAWRRRIMA